MMWLVLIIIVICLVWVWWHRSHGEPNINQSNEQYRISLPAIVVDVDTVEEDLIAVITAAIHEFTGTSDFEVVRIRPSAEKWTLTGRQNSVSNW